MSAQLILLSALASLTLARPGFSAVPTSNQSAAQTPAEVAHFLADGRRLVQVPVKGKVRQSIEEEAPTFTMPSGPSSVVLLRLPDYEAPYDMTIVSFRRGIGRTTEIFIPSGLYLDADFQQRGEFGEDRLVGGVESVGVRLAVDETNKNARYLLLYTRGDLVHQRVDMRASIDGVAVPGKVGTFLGSGFGLGRFERSLKAKLEVETRPATRPNLGSDPVRATPGQVVPGAVYKGADSLQDGVSLPTLLKEVKPEYPRQSRKAGIQGVVVLECVVLPTGEVGDVRVTRPVDRQLDQEAIKAAKRWRFKPGIKDGQPVSVLVTIQLSFELRETR